MKKKFDNLERRCPRLGGQIAFKYCRTCGDDLIVCSKIIDCWWEKFDVMNYCQKLLPEESFHLLIQNRPKAKITSLIEIIEQAKRRIT